MFEVLKILYNSPYGSFLWFKWGTALYFFYWLSRFSVDLDFDLTKDLSVAQINTLKYNMLDYIQSKLSNIKAYKNIKIKIEGNLDHSFRYVLQYGWQKKLKIEVNSYIPQYKHIYEIKTLLWVAVQVMDIRYMFAHKLCALISRYKKNTRIANRDLFDMLFLLQKDVPISENIIKIRTQNMLNKQMNVLEYMQYILSFIDTHKQKIQWNILTGLGELVDNKQKDYMKTKFVDDVIYNIQLFLMP